MRTRKFASFALVATFCAGCSGNGSVSPPVGASNQTQRTSGVSARFVIKVPNTHKSGTVRPEYISTSTQSLAIAVDAGAPTNVNLTPTSPNCTSTSGTLTCTATVSVTVGKHSFVLIAYDAPNGAGKALSSSTLADQSVPVGGATIPVVLGGIVASIALSLSSATPASGAPVTIALAVTAKDPDGNTIVGPGNYANGPISLTDSDTSGATSFSSSAAQAGTTIAAPGSVNVYYNGATSLLAATFSANLSPALPGSAITQAVLIPRTASASGGAVAIAVATIGGSTYAFVPVPTGLAQVKVATGATLLSSHVAVTRGSVAVPLSRMGRRDILHALATRRSGSAAPISPIIPLSPMPNECTSKETSSDLFLYCMNFGSATVNVVDINLGSGAASNAGQFAVDTSSSVSFSGGSCVICGIAYDPQDDALVMATTAGYELYDATHYGTKLKAVTAFVSENFGYNPSSDQIWSPQYSSPTGATLELVDVKGGVDYALSPQPTGIAYPDSGSVDASTNIAIAPEEFLSGAGSTVYLTALSSQALNAPAAGMFTATTVTQTLVSPDFLSGGGALTTTSAVDATSHIAFLGSEFAAPATFGAVQLPASATAPLAVGDYVFANLPNTPNGLPFASGGDPHAIATFVLAGSTILGITFNADDTYIAVFDLRKLLAAPRSATDPHGVQGSYDLLGNGVVTYFAI